MVVKQIMSHFVLFLIISTLHHGFHHVPLVQEVDLTGCAALDLT